MSDDIASFFKSKKSKKHGGHRGHGAMVQTPEELAKRLERTVLQQQELDRENGVEEEDQFAVASRPPLTREFSGGGGGPNATGVGSGEQNNEDSEWLDVQEQQDIDVEKFGIKEMELRDESDEAENDEDESQLNRKTWNIPGQQKPQKPQKPKVMFAEGMDVDVGDDEESKDSESAAAVKTENNEKEQEASSTRDDANEKDGERMTKYISPAMRKALQTASMRQPGKKQPNIENAEEFPSLADALKMEEETEKMKKKKPLPQQHVVKQMRPPIMQHQRQESPRRPEPKSAVVASPSPEPENKPDGPPQGSPKPATGSTYVPPHLRGKK